MTAFVFLQTAGNCSRTFLTGSMFYRSLKIFNPLFSFNCRNFLSPAYACSDLWSEQRLRCDSLKHISPERYFFELNQKFQQKQKISAVDVDIYSNSVYKSENQEELEHIIKRFRQTRLTTTMFDSTHHAVCRFYLQNGKCDHLLWILNQRVQFGIFPDVIICNLILDQALQNDALDEAFEMVKLMMLQEDSGNEITKCLALHTLIQMLIREKVATEAVSSEEKSDETQDEDNEDIEYIRVPYLTNPYFDDHFDLVDRNHIFGKSLYFFGYELSKSPQATESDNLLSVSAQIIGLIFYQKWNKLKNLLKQSTSNKITSDVLEIAEKHFEKCQEDAAQTELKNIIQLLHSMPQESSARLQFLVETRLGSLPILEQTDIEMQKKLFDNFEKVRVEAIRTQLDLLIRAEKQAEIEAKKKEIEQKKRLYYFFENFPKHEIDFVDAEKRIKEIQSQTVVDEDYIPPEI